MNELPIILLVIWGAYKIHKGINVIKRGEL